MNFRSHRAIRTVLSIALCLPPVLAHAQLGNMLNGATGSTGSSTGSLGSLSSLGGLGNVSSGSLGNATGVLEFCIKNNYLGGGDASGVKDQLMSKLSSKGSPSSDSGYTDGAKGLLTSSSGKQLDLSGGGLKAEATKQVCDKVLSQAKSML
ncbi:DUF2501 domain-containing protein [Pararobbsia silviterrae]|uniref:DUF2501 domain-containing protein n=1 Tax=Pararobbsia silviterrae TaxID=1792498 RepID=A0A494Y8B2_9BURK|nr:DUF2501 domain-containing protein [Pararobbsia silviterrae]RKP58884.1 DUF2501 domain-containing protein [Pararobbsia silviterrae]